jgi:hypothetical protein
MAKKFIDFNDTSIPVGRRKQAYWRWLVYSKGYDKKTASVWANQKFGLPKGKDIDVLIFISTEMSRHDTIESFLEYNIPKKDRQVFPKIVYEQPTKQELDRYKAQSKKRGREFEYLWYAS